MSIQLVERANPFAAELSTILEPGVDVNELINQLKAIVSLVGGNVVAPQTFCDMASTKVQMLNRITQSVVDKRRNDTPFRYDNTFSGFTFSAILDQVVGAKNAYDDKLDALIAAAWIVNATTLTRLQTLRSAAAQARSSGNNAVRIAGTLINEMLGNVTTLVTSPITMPPIISAKIRHNFKQAIRLLSHLVPNAMVLPRYVRTAVGQPYTSVITLAKGDAAQPPSNIFVSPVFPYDFGESAGTYNGVVMNGQHPMGYQENRASFAFATVNTLTTPYVGPNRIGWFEFDGHRLGDKPFPAYFHLTVTVLHKRGVDLGAPATLNGAVFENNDTEWTFALYQNNVRIMDTITLTVSANTNTFHFEGAIDLSKGQLDVYIENIANVTVAPGGDDFWSVNVEMDGLYSNALVESADYNLYYWDKDNRYTPLDVTTWANMAFRTRDAVCFPLSTSFRVYLHNLIQPYLQDYAIAVSLLMSDISDTNQILNKYRKLIPNQSNDEILSLLSNPLAWFTYDDRYSRDGSYLYISMFGELVGDLTFAYSNMQLDVSSFAARSVRRYIF